MGMAGGKIPAFMNHLESGSFSLSSESGINYYNIQLIDIEKPKGILVYSNAFDITNPKADKPLLGAYAALYTTGTGEPAINGNAWSLQLYSTYAVNWGANTDQKNPSWRSSRTETRGIRWYTPSTRLVYLVGFGTGEYDFKYDVTYNWIAWD